MSLANLCMLCQQSSEVSIEIFSIRGMDLNVEAILKQHFWFDVDELEERNVCEKCWLTVHAFHLLYNSAKLNHQRQSVVYLKSDVDADVRSELPTMLDAIKEELQIDIEDDLEHSPDDIPDVPDTQCHFEKEPNDDSPTLPQASQSTNRNLPPTEKVNNSDCHAKLLSRYFKMTCDRCDARLSTYRETKRHYKYVHKTRGFLICCSRKFYYLPEMLEHCQWHTNPDSFRCGSCPKTFIDSYRLRNHVSKSHSTATGEVFKCNDCDKVFSKQQYLDNHVKNVLHKPDLHKEHELIRNRFLMQCDLCAEPFAVLHDAKIHYAEAHNQEGYLLCCERKFFKMSSAVQHCMWHSDRNSLKCSICEITFSDRARLRDHVRKVHSLEAVPFPKSAVQKSNMKVLVTDEKGANTEKENQQFECFICNQRFLILPLLKKHMNKVHRSASHICELCAKPFTSGKSYNRHYAIFHTNMLQKVQCEQCGKWMKHEISLKQHMRRHRIRTATCGICGQVCRNSGFLKRHINYFHRQPSFECTVCGKKCKRELVLKEHMAIHAGVTDLYTCTFCTKTFRSKANMYTHRKRAHPEEFEKMKGSLNCAPTPTATT